MIKTLRAGNDARVGRGLDLIAIRGLYGNEQTVRRPDGRRPTR
jgi:hypothetical protein